MVEIKDEQLRPLALVPICPRVIPVSALISAASGDEVSPPKAIGNTNNKTEGTNTKTHACFSYAFSFADNGGLRGCKRCWAFAFSGALRTSRQTREMRNLVGFERKGQIDP